MTKYKLEKHNDGRPCYKYRDFVIANKNVFLNTPATWVVKARRCSSSPKW